MTDLELMMRGMTRADYLKELQQEWMKISKWTRINHRHAYKHGKKYPKRWKPVLEAEQNEIR